MQPTQVLGIELKLLGNNQYESRSCLISKKNNAITIESTQTSAGSLVEILETLSTNYPVALDITGKGLLYKNLQLTTGLNNEQIFQSAFPAADQKDFYVQHYHEDNNFLVHIIRKQSVDDLLAKLKNAGLTIYVLSLGAIVTVHSWPLLNIYQSPIKFSEHVFELGTSKKFAVYNLQAEQKNEFQLKIGEEPIEAHFIIAYAAAMQLILHEKVELVKANVGAIEADFNHFIGNMKLKKTGLVYLVGLFVSLLVSYLMLDHYNAENAKLNSIVGTRTATADQTDLMRKTSAENEVLLKQLNWNGGYNYGFLLNEIGSSLPKQLKLQEVLMNDFKTESEKAARKPNLKITGTTDDLTAVNNWIFVLKEKPWVKNVQLLKYQNDLESTYYQFNLIINY